MIQIFNEQVNEYEDRPMALEVLNIRTPAMQPTVAGLFVNALTAPSQFRNVKRVKDSVLLLLFMTTI